MDIVALQSKIRKLEIKSKLLSNHFFAGDYQSAFKGKGMLFKEVKEYHAGDDIRFIDWNVSARMNNAYSKVFEEERNLSVYFIVDASQSNYFGTRLGSKMEKIVEIVALLSFCVLRNNDKCGLLMHTQQPELFIPASKGKKHVLYLLRQLMTHQTKFKGTNLNSALQWIHEFAKQKSVVFILSDFADEAYEQQLKILAKHHDIIGIRLYDEADLQLPQLGLIRLQDAETGAFRWIDTRNKRTQQDYRQQSERIGKEATATFKNAGANLISISLNEDYVGVLHHFFQSRHKKKT